MLGAFILLAAFWVVLVAACGMLAARERHEPWLTVAAAEAQRTPVDNCNLSLAQRIGLV